jgi:oxygen-independent coproporphyrinogen-3 oxidase
MAGIYIHIPYCKQACSYCDFYFTVHLLDKQEFIKALLEEIESRTAYLENQTIETIYFGGGTPSQLSTQELNSIIEAIRMNYSVTGNVEITVETNPDNLTEDYLKQLSEIGANRLSIGIQSFKNEDLTLMNRAHNAAEAKNCISLARVSGFNNISIDLIYGLPNSSIEDWQNNIQQALKLNPEHISAYNLTIETGTPLAHLVSKGRVSIPSDDEVVLQHNLLVDLLSKAGFEHYETSNFAKQGFRSKHNSSYWKGIHYLGFGPSAHSFNGTSRSWNIANTKKYVDLIRENKTHFESETLSLIDRINEFIMTGLRTVEGIDLNHFENNFGKKRLAVLLQESANALSKQYLALDQNRLFVTPKGKVLLDGITSDLFFE